MYPNRRTFIKNMALAGACAFVSFSPKKLFGAEAADIYRETISIIKKAYLREIQAHIAYTKFSQKALAEDYPNIAYLFRSFAEAESIHGRNFRNNLTALGGQPGSPEDNFEVLSTKENLGQAIDLELQEINIYYPDHLSKIKNEEHWNSIASIAHALASEKQHEDMLRKMQKGTGVFWNILKKRIEEEDVAFFICQVCGSTLTAIPGICPVCSKPNTFYKKIEKHL